MRRSGQVRLTETMAVLFIFFVLIFFGILFFYQYQKSSLKERSQELLAARAMDTTLKTLFLPELLCTQGEAEPEDNCVDLMKLRHANETIKQHLPDYYFDLFSYAQITLYQVYPSSRQFVLYNKEKIRLDGAGNEIKDWTQKEPTYFVVSLRDQVTAENGQATYGFGYLVVEAYS